MENKLLQEEIEKLKNELMQKKDELEIARQNQNITQISPQDKFIETIFDKGGEILIEYTKLSTDTQKYEIDKATEIEKQELITINKLDLKEKIYKGLLIGICIVALVLIPIYIKESQMVIPVLSLVIGLLFKSNSVSDFISYRKKSKSDENE